MLRHLSPFGRFSIIGQLYAAFALVALLLAGTASYAIETLVQGTKNNVDDVMNESSLTASDPGFPR